MSCLRAAALSILVLSGRALSAQEFIGSPLADRRRIDEILGRASTAGSLIRSSSETRPGIRTPNTDPDVPWTFIAPIVDGTWNSNLPFSINDGSRWAGRGLSGRITLGARAAWSGLHAQIAPEFVYVRNDGFPLLPSRAADRSAYASPFFLGPQSADAPLRFGAKPFTMIMPGQSALWASFPGADVGVATENQWWGPAIQNALVMTNNAAGFPHAFVRTNRLLETPMGGFEGKLIAGVLTNSLFFDSPGVPQNRTLSGIVFDFHPALERNLALGASRVVYSPMPLRRDFASHAFDALSRWSTHRQDTLATPMDDRYDQLFSLFARWVFPETGLEVYGEWSRVLPPASLRDWLVRPQHTQGYTIGMQSAGSIRPGALLRFQLELTDLEQSFQSLAADTLSFYTSRDVPAGYTQRGKFIGAGIGPGSSSQFIALDYMPRRWDIGLFATRIRWADDAYFIQPTGFSFFSHDVSVVAGLRGTAYLYGGVLHAEWGHEQRMNFLFQNLGGGYGENHENDVHNLTLRIWYSPWVGRRIFRP